MKSSVLSPGFMRIVKQQGMLISILCLIAFSFSFCNPSGRSSGSEEVLVLFGNEAGDAYGYKNLRGEVVIPAGKYAMCFTDTFKTYAIVADAQKGMIAIDRQEKLLYKVFPYDNGPDDVSNGLFRIIDGDKIGYADAASGKIVIKPQYPCAWPFENGTAKVATNCRTETYGGEEHSTWESDQWFYINTKGEKVPAPEH